jgi:hypothetical protein
MSHSPPKIRNGAPYHDLLADRDLVRVGLSEIVIARATVVTNLNDRVLAIAGRLSAKRDLFAPHVLDDADAPLQLVEVGYRRQPVGE